MNRYYIILPVVCMAVFIFFERGASKETERRKQEQIAVKKAEEEKKLAERKALEEKARIDSDKRAAERLAEEKAKDEKRKADFAAKIQRLVDDTKKLTDDIELNKKLIEKMEKELAEKRVLHEKENRLVLDLAKKVEISKKARRSAELEVQRFTEMLTNRANESSLTKSPLVATAENPSK